MMPASTKGVAPTASKWSLTIAALADCVALLTLAFVLRFAFLGQEPLWTDELFTVYWSQLDPHYLFGQGARIETNPPTYYLLMHAWVEAFGNTAMSVRFPSLLFSVATVPVVYAIGRTLMGRFTALLAGLFAAIDAAAIYFAQEARSYALVSFLDGLAILALSCYASRFSASGLRPWPWLVLFVLTAVGTFLTHYTSAIFITGCFVAIGLQLVTTRPLPIREALIWAAAGLFIALAVINPLLLAKDLSTTANISWIGPLTASAVKEFFMDLMLHPEIPYNGVEKGAVAVLFIILAAALFRLDRLQFGLMLLVPAVFCLILIGASIWRPMLLSRVGVWLTIPLCLLLARATTVQPTVWRRTAAVTVSSLIFLSALGHYFLRVQKEDWRSAARMVALEPRCDGPIIFVRGGGLGLIYYMPSLATRPLYMAKANETDPNTASFALAQQVVHPRIIDVGALADFVRTHPHAALVLRWAFLRMADPLQQPFVRAELHGGLTVSCF